eukprot:CAMPEP_0175560860 /NCGR_PEP_ID=MMETSP0096-20121207/37121_1 /TAXON_ID=311494 /ORGANISM="Alexandrium monilatum, Strain CCMP3105" /LENGTH=713 /DNA_ID=CAMNT_0016864079 /DNA_START=22 /DNA_END=2162 /DNA_ORIENTATION=+
MAHLAEIRCVSNEECDRWEHAARQLALQAEQAAGQEPLLASVESHGGGQQLLLRALQLLSRRVALLHAAAAVREADVNNPARGLESGGSSEPPHLGIHPLLVPVPGHEHLHLGQDPGNLGSDDPEEDAPTVKLGSGSTYVFDLLEGGTHVGIREIPADNTSVAFAEAGQTESGLGWFTVDGEKAPEEVFIKEKLPELDGGGMPLLLRQATLEACTCAVLTPLDCFVKIRAMQVFPDRIRMIFRRLPGRGFDDFLDTLEEQGRRATESEILGGALLTLGAYVKLNLAGFSQRDAKAENLWLSVSDNILRVVITDSEAVFRAGHIEDAHMVGLGNEVWQLRSLKERKLWKFGGSTFSRAVTVFAANVDLQSKQCLPGEQAIVYSLTEIILRMMGEGERVSVCDDDARWEDALRASVACDLFSDSDEEQGPEEDDGKGKPSTAAAKARPSASTAYSPAFLHLVMTLRRRRSFTQGGVDAFLDLGQAVQLCRDFIAEHLHSAEAACLADFAKLVGQMASPHAVAPSTDRVERVKSDDEYDPLDAKPSRPWSELSHKDVAKYHVCPVTEQVEEKGAITFQLVGFALRKKLALKFGSNVEFYMKTPHTVGKKPQPVCLANLAWWRRLPRIEEIVQQCLRLRSRDLPALGELLAKALEQAWQHPLRVHSDVLCLHLDLSKDHFRGYQGLPGWPMLVMYPFTDELTQSVADTMREQVSHRT